MAETLKGGCACGAVRFTAAPENHEYGACHCDTCSRWAAGPFMALRCGTTLKIEDESALGTYKSSQWAERGFCTKCGSSLYYTIPGKPFTNVSVGAFDDTSEFVFKRQVFIDEKPAHYSFANDTDMMTGEQVFAAFGRSDSEGE